MPASARRSLITGVCGVALRLQRIRIGFWNQIWPGLPPNKDSLGRMSNHQRYTWKTRAYPVSSSGRRGFQWRAATLRSLEAITRRPSLANPATIVVPALWNLTPGEGVAAGWFRELEALRPLRMRIVQASRHTGWDVFTFHTLHNPDPFFNSTIETLRDTWIRERSLSQRAVERAQRDYGRPWDYACIRARLVESLVFQTAQLDWIQAKTVAASLQTHFIGTALFSALAWSAAVSFDAAVDLAETIGGAWDRELNTFAQEELQLRGIPCSDEALGGARQQAVLRLIKHGRPFPVTRPVLEALRIQNPGHPFLYSALPHQRPVMLKTSEEIRAAIEALDIASWAGERLPLTVGGIQGWLMSPRHPSSRACRWSLTNCSLSTPAAVSLFFDYIAPIRRPAVAGVLETEGLQNRLRLSRMKVTGP